MHIQPASKKKSANWLLEPTVGHLVQFYDSQSYLLSPLGEFISSGLTKGEICIVIATPKHITALRDDMIEIGVNVYDAEKSGQLVFLDAAETLEKFMVNGLPDPRKFFNLIGASIATYRDKGQPVRAYGEMVALLWKSGHREAVIALENLWNELIEKYAFSLYCAYPKLQFTMDSGFMNEISHCHDVPNSLFVDA